MSPNGRFSFWKTVGWLIACAAITTACGTGPSNGHVSGTAEKIDQQVSSAILSTYESGYSIGECSAEGHIILKIEKNKDVMTVYAVVSYGEWGFENGIFTKISGSGAIPTVITFEKAASESESDYFLKEFKEPKDGSYFEPSIKEMFPLSLRIPALNAHQYYSKLERQEEVYARRYLSSIGRDAKIQADNTEMPLDSMNVEAADCLLELEMFNEFPFWIGTRETIENGERYVYEKAWEDHGDGDGIVTFTKRIYEGDIVEKTVIRVEKNKLIFLEGNSPAED